MEKKTKSKEYTNLENRKPHVVNDIIHALPFQLGKFSLSGNRELKGEVSWGFWYLLLKMMK